MTPRSWSVVIVLGALVAALALVYGAAQALEWRQARACRALGHVYSPAGPEGVSQCWVVDRRPRLTEESA